MQKTNWLALGAIMGSLGWAAISPAQAAEADVKDAAVNYQPFTLSADASTLGLGLTASWRFSDLLGVRGGINYFSYTRDNNEVEGIVYNTKLRLLSEPVGLDIYPWKEHSVRVTLGVLINQNRFTGVSPQQLAGTLIPLGNSGGIDSAAIGDLRMKVDQNVVAPYLAIGGSWYFDDAKHWAVSGEVGVAYAGKPDVTLTRSNGPDAIDAQVAIEKQQLEDSLKKYQFYPIVKFSLSFSF